ncbi:MAG: hypothetical protein NZ928_07665 [Endomicrobia bacterium]|nr:hypothetical protein [Endomicrobiia bacterium]MDW8056338.1 hypothetical protein [Elusimicrobiota bacterium]
MRVKCVLLFSGGLDSTLAGMLLAEIGVDVYPFKITTPFLASKKDTRTKLLEERLQRKVYVYKVGMDYIKLILNPKHGYGKGLNPCVDCKIYMFKKAKQYMEEINADFIATGEVLNQRPMSQRGWQMRIIEKEAEVDGYVLRPLCAKVLKETILEKQGLVDRDKLLDISGRQRVRQIELARKYKIDDVSISGGCLLTDKNYIERFKNLINHFADFTVEDVELLRYGRHFYVDGTKIIVGRNEYENEIIKGYYSQEKHLIISDDIGPTVLGYRNKDLAEEKIMELMLKYFKKYARRISD